MRLSAYRLGLGQFKVFRVSERRELFQFFDECSPWGGGDAELYHLQAWQAYEGWRRFDEEWRRFGFVPPKGNPRVLVS